MSPPTPIVPKPSKWSGAWSGELLIGDHGYLLVWSSHVPGEVCLQLSAGAGVFLEVTHTGPLEPVPLFDGSEVRLTVGGPVRPTELRLPAEAWERLAAEVLEAQSNAEEDKQ